jgi:hypothetical protein
MPTRDPSQAQITEAVQAVLNTRTWTDCKQIVEARRDILLTDAAEQFMAALLDQYRGNEEATEALLACRVLLARCRHQGIDAAFADRLHAGEMLDIPQHLMQRFLAVRSEEELRALLDEHPELLPALQHMATQVQASQGSRVSRPLPDELRALLQESLNLSQFVEDQNGPSIGQILPFWLCGQWLGLTLPARSVRPVHTHCIDESCAGIERTRRTLAGCTY